MQRSLALMLGFVASLGALLVGALMAVFLAVVVFVSAILASAGLAFAGAALRARRAMRQGHEEVIEARHVGGHHWIACGWDGGR